MPPKVTYTKEKILEAGIRIVREEGVEHLNARNVAKVLGGSTQPIYRVFRSIGELEDAVIERLIPMAMRYMLEGEDAESSFLAIGLGYLAFAREEPNAFALLFESGKKKWSFTQESPFIPPIMEKMREDWFLRDLDTTILLELFREMFIFTHGLCTLSSIHINRTDPGQERRLLHDTGGRLIMMSVLKEKNPHIFAEIERSLQQ